ncbi:glycosyltransferase [Pseudomonas sp. NA-150]|uniref:glycosyltransferase n=1 Tax=Pseudomonas sp. NA-150 TaxID=3367525 RepID=UPI0037C9D1AB
MSAPYSIALVNYKTLELTKACLELLREGLQGTHVPVVVVDNYSNDESTEYLRSLDWITLIERERGEAESGSAAHGRALDLALAKVDTDYLFVLHTDTFIYDFDVFRMMMEQCRGSNDVAAVGCREQLDRGIVRATWRLVSRLCKHYSRRSVRAMGMHGKDPKPFRETHLKSFCALWNVRLMKKLGLRFSMDKRNPGYEAQERMQALGYKVRFLSPRKVFSYLDHIQSGTVSAMGGYSTNHRRVHMYKQLMGGL